MISLIYLFVFRIVFDSSNGCEFSTKYYCIPFALSVTNSIILLASKTTPELNGDIYIKSADTIGKFFVRLYEYCVAFLIVVTAVSCSYNC